MAGPLTKKTNQGELYARPAEIEEAIREAQSQDLAILISRAGIPSRSTTGFMPLECLLHLIRDALRTGDHEKANRLLPWLLKRCETILKTRIPAHLVANVDDVKDEILGKFAELIAEDCCDPKQRLDFYECRFNNAFQALRTPLIARARREHEARVVPSKKDIEDGRTDDEFLSGLALDLRASSSLDPERRRALLNAIETLPLDQRKAVTLVYVFGHPEESDNPAVDSAAKLCGVSGRAIRYRLAKAIKTLSDQLNRKDTGEQFL